MVVLNKVFAFPCMKEETAGNVIVFEVSSLSGESKVYLANASTLSGLAMLPGDKEDIPPMPYFADILFKLITSKEGFEGLSYTTEPTENSIKIFRPDTNDLIEISYYEKNDEYRILSCANLIDIAVRIQSIIAEISPRVIVMIAYQEGHDVDTPETPSETVPDIEETEGDNELLKGVTELEKRYMETEPEEEEGVDKEGKSETNSKPE